MILTLIKMCGEYNPVSMYIYDQSVAHALTKIPSYGY